MIFFVDQYYTMLTQNLQVFFFEDAPTTAAGKTRDYKRTACANGLAAAKNTVFSAVFFSRRPVSSSGHSRPIVTKYVYYIFQWIR